MSAPAPGVPLFVGLDWGSTRLRGYAIGANGTVLDRAESGAGILQPDRPERAADLGHLLRPWRQRWGEVPVVASGMVGAVGGLIEAPYVATPAGVRELRPKLVTRIIDGMRITVVPGLVHRAAGRVDVLRGEETIAVGLAACVDDDADRLAVLPGTHSKWVTMSNGRITEFTTFATGELFDLLRRAGSLTGLGPARSAADSAAFCAGVRAGLSSPGLLHDFFALRAVVVAGADSATGLIDRLSGLLIGAEIAEARRRGVLDRPGVDLVADGPNLVRYRDALAIAQVRVQTGAVEECLVRGWSALSGLGGVGRAGGHS